MPKLLSIASVLLLVALSYVPCFADSSSSEEVIEVKDGVRFEFKQRLRDLKEQIDKGVEKGWITSDQGTVLNAEHDRLLIQTNKAKEVGWPKDQVDKLEKVVTAFSAKVSRLLTKGVPAPKASDKTGK